MVSKYEYYPVKGIQAAHGQTIPERREINTWYRERHTDELIWKQVNLFLRALRKFQDVPPDETLSFFQIAGIHGQPYKPWDEPDPSAMKDQGYCAHGNALFPTWHRPYLALYEQRIHEIMKELIPSSSPKKADFTQAADTWRLPYWDWAVVQTFNDYVVKIRYSKFMLQGNPFRMEIYLASNDDQNARDPEKDYRIKSVYNFSTPVAIAGGQAACHNCLVQEAIDVSCYAVVPLTHDLPLFLDSQKKPGDHPSKFQPGEVKKLLDSRLYYRIFTQTGREVEYAAKDFEAVVYHGKVEISEKRGEHALGLGDFKYDQDTL